MLVHALPAFAQTPVEETEPNNTPATADTADLHRPATGRVGTSSGSDGFDYWLVHLTQGDTLQVAGSGCETCDDGNLYLTLFAADGVTRVADGRRWQAEDPQLTYVVPATGPYYLRVTLGSEALGDVVTYTLNFAARRCPENFGEPNDSLQRATPITLGSTVDGLWCPTGDQDFYELRLTAGTVFEFSMDGYLGNGHYYPDLPAVHLLGPSGENLDAEVQNDFGPKRYTVRTTGTYYLNAVSERGGVGYSYRLRVGESEFRPGPGDPPIVRAPQGVGNMAVDTHGNFWGPPGNDVLGRLSLDGTLARFNPPGISAAVSVAWDPWGNMLVLNGWSITKFVPPSLTEPFVTLDMGASGLAVTTDAMWVVNGWTGTTWIYQYALDGHLMQSFHLTDLRAFDLRIGPSGDPYFAADNAIYRFRAGVPELVLKHDEPSQINSFVFDTLGNIYVADDGVSSRVRRRGTPRVSLHRIDGSMVADTFAWWPHNAHNLTFGRDADGTTNSHLYILDQGRLLELNHAAIRAPGLPIQPVGVCPVDAAEAEPNDAPAMARTIGSDTAITGFSCRAGDLDVFRFDATRDQTIVFDLAGADLPTLELLAADGTRLASSDARLTAYPHISYATRASQTYYVRVGSWFGGPKPYTLRITRLPTAADHLTLERAARELARPGAILTGAERQYLDEHGNRNGRYDVGDFRAYYTLLKQGGGTP